MENLLTKFKLIKYVLIVQSLSVTALAQESLGTREYDAHNDSGTYQLEAWAGDHAVYYHNPDEVNLDENGIATVLGYFDTAMELFWRYGGSNYPLADEDCSSDAHSEFPNTGSVLLLPYTGGGAGLGCNGAAEMYGSWWNSDSLANHPTDVRTWGIGVYELGRLSTSAFPINQYFETPDAENNDLKSMAAALPHLVKAVTRVESGLTDAMWIDDPYWGPGNEFRAGDNPIHVLDVLQNEVFTGNTDYLDFYSTDDGKLDYGSNNEFSLVTVHWLLFYYLREQYGESFLTEFFDFAKKYAEEMEPATGAAIAQNIIRAGNVALSRVSNVGANENIVGNYLQQNFGFPTYFDNQDIRLDSAVTRVAAGQETVISWDVWGSNIPAGAGVQVFVDTGSGWQFDSSYSLGQASIKYLVPQTNTFRVFIGLTSSGRWLATDLRAYHVVNASVTLNAVPDGLSNVGHARISWETAFEIHNSEFQLFVDYPNDGRSWIFLGSTDKESRDMRVPIEDGFSSATFYLGLSKNGGFVTSAIRTFSISDDN